MSHWFRGTVIRAEASAWGRFSVHACQRDNGDYVIVAVNKGTYDAVTGALLPDQTTATALIQGLPRDSGYHLSRLFRLGQDDPFPL